jgi:hypothetical protein
MIRSCLTASALLAAIAFAGTLAAAPAQQGQPPQQQLPPPKAYKAVPIQLPKPLADPSHEAFRKQLAGIAQKKDRAALGRLIANNFFWIPEDKDVADKRKPGIDNLAKALGLDGRQAPGWDVLASIVTDATAEPYADRQGVVCGPAGPMFDEKAADELATETGTEGGDWGYPAKDGVAVRSALAPNSPVTEKLGLHLIRVYPDDSPAAAAQGDAMRIVTPSGKVGYVNGEDVLPLDTDQICYVKEGNAWKIAGVIGGFQ